MLSPECAAVKCGHCSAPVYAIDHDGGCPMRLMGLTTIHDGVILEVEVVWHGGIADRFGGYGRGELLGPYNKPRRF